MTQSVVTLAGTDAASAWPGTWGNFLNSLFTSHSGASRPSYAQTGMMWLNSSTNVVSYYDGTQDIPLFAIDTTNHLLNPPIGGGTASLASAATTDLGSVPQTGLTITGTTTINGFGSSMKPGQVKTVSFSGALTLTHNATSLILPGAANIVTAVGDCAIVRCESSGNYRAIDYQRASGQSVISPLGLAQTWTAAQRGAVVNLTDGATITPDFALANNFAVTLGGNRTLAIPTSLVVGQDGWIGISQDATGSRALAFAWGWQFAGGMAPTLSTPGATRDDFYYSVKVAASAAIAITIASPGVVSWTGHGLATGQKVQLTTTGALPTGLSTNTTYYVVRVDANSFSLATSLPNAAAGTKINTTGSQSGTHTCTAITIAASLVNGVA